MHAHIIIGRKVKGKNMYISTRNNHQKSTGGGFVKHGFNQNKSKIKKDIKNMEKFA